MTSAVRYVALGDSRAAGPTWFSFLEGDGCSRTPNGYPNLVAAALKPASFASVACSGARTENIVSTPQRLYFPSAHTVPVQLDAVHPDTTLVTLSIGGNDLDWSTLIAPCFAALPGVDEHCRDDVALGEKITTLLDKLRPAVGTVLAAVHEKAPHATVVVVGHGGYYGDEGCFPDNNAHGGDAELVKQFFIRFNAVLHETTTQYGDTFVDVAAAAVGHDTCRPADERWFTGLYTPGNTPFFHPTPLGSAAMARMVLAAIGR